MTELILVALVFSVAAGMVGFFAGSQRRQVPRDPAIPTIIPRSGVLTAPPLTGRNWVGLTTVEDVDDAAAASEFARLQDVISSGQHVDVVSGSKVQWCKGEKVYKQFGVA